MVLVFNKNKKQPQLRNNGNGHAEMREYQTRIGLLCDIAEEANSITQVTTLLERILKVTQNTVGSSIAALFLMDDTKARVHLPITVSKYEDDTTRRAMVIESEIVSLAAGGVTALKINNVGADPRFNPKGYKTPDLAVKSVIAAPVLKGKKVIGVIMAANKEGGTGFSERDYEVLKGFAATEALILLVSLEKTAIENVNSLNPALLEGYRNAVNELASTIDVKDDHVYEHAKRVKDYALMAAASLSLNPGELQAIEFGALLHDIGKIGIDGEILRKPGPLTDEEWKFIYTHPQKGADILKDIPHLKEATNIVLSHHEKYDGTGYPKKLKGEEIPIGARLIAVANAFDTMTTDHPYRAALSAGEAIKELVNATGSQFCPRCIEAFISAFNKQRVNQQVKTIPGDAKAKAARPTPTQITQVQTESQNAAKNLIINVKKDSKEIKTLREKAERQAREAKARNEKDAREAKIKAEKAARDAKTRSQRNAESAKILKIKSEKAAREAKIREAKATREARIRAKKAAKEAKIQAAEAAREAKIRAEKVARDAKIRTVKAAKEARIKANKDSEAAKILKIKMEKEARKAKIQAAKAARDNKIRAEKEAREAKIKARKEAEEARILKVKSEKEAKEAKITAEKVAREAKLNAQQQAEEARIVKVKSEKEAKETKAIAEKIAQEAKNQAEKAVEEARIQAEKRAREISKAKQAEKELKAARSKQDTEVLKGTIRLVVPLAVPTEAAKKFGRYMEKIEGVKVIMLSHSEEEGHLFLVGLQRPMTLMRLIKDIPLVRNVAKKGETICVGLKEEMIF